MAWSGIWKGFRTSSHGSWFPKFLLLTFRLLPVRISAFVLSQFRGSTILNQNTSPSMISLEIIFPLLSGSIKGNNAWHLIWNLELLECIKVFIWKCLKGILSVRSGLHSRMSNISPVCSLCSIEEETIDHLLLLLQQTRAVWNLSNMPYSSMDISSPMVFKD